MNFLKFLFNLVNNVRRNTTVVQFIIFIFLLLFMGCIGIFTLIKIVIPFTYIAL